MGKRKTRRRSSRRRKKGGNPLLSLFGIKSLCIWYGDGNIKAPSINNEMKKTFFGNKLCGPCCKSGISDFQPSKNNFYAVSTSAKDEFQKDDTTALIQSNFHVPGILNKDNIEVYNGTQQGNYNVYAIRYQKNCRHGGKRYELLKIDGCHIKGTLSGVVNGVKGVPGVTVTPATAPVLKFESEGEKKMNVTVTLKGQEKEIKGLEVGSFLLEKLLTRRNTTGGKKKRRKRTKKKSRKKRKRTKKRRRRRR